MNGESAIVDHYWELWSGIMIGNRDRDREWDHDWESWLGIMGGILIGDDHEESCIRNIIGCHDWQLRLVLTIGYHDGECVPGL